MVSTHSRPKAAALAKSRLRILNERFNTQPPEGGCYPRFTNGRQKAVFQHTAARRRLHVSAICEILALLFQHTAARRRLRENLCYWGLSDFSFQHTAARRRLHIAEYFSQLNQSVSTHSRPKAAAGSVIHQFITTCGFNTQPPEGGCLRLISISLDL